MMNGHLDRLDEISIHGSSNGDNSHSSHTGGSKSGGSGIDSSLSDSHGHSTGTNHRENAEAEIIASKVSKQVFWLKMTVIFVLLTAALLVAVAIYLSTQRSEVSTFEAAFNDHASKLFDTFKFNVERKLGAVDALSVAITSLAVDTNTTWPYFTIPDFEYRAANARELADAASITFLPLVSLVERPRWEQYSVDNRQWVADAQAFEAALTSRKLRSPDLIDGISRQIYTLVDGKRSIDDSIGPFLPIWQHSPIAPSTINYNLITNDNFKDGIGVLLETGDAVIGKIWDLTDANEVFTELSEAFQKDSGLQVDDPVSMVFYPVFDSLSAGHGLVAILASVINWQTYFEKILPPHANGVICVLENECGQVVTFQINGEEAVILGHGDLHDDHYDYLGQSLPFDELIQPEDRRIERFTDVSLNKDFCPYSLSVYPTADLEDDFITNNAIIYTVCVVIIFAFTGAVFLIYDCIVERRQQLVMKRAVQSRAIVSSLFPAAVRDRLFRNDDSVSKNKGDGNARGFKKRSDPAKMRLKSFLHDGPDQERRPMSDLRPIADLFPHTTVMFADIAGFTSWSSDRDPAHVFTLLQTVYHAFDRIAKKRGVFKVETIGDCYVAVTGLPDPQEDHALRMAKFANECKNKMLDLVNKLKESLGEDTAELCMRFGLHSGPVTAGVLRGEKSRFQLFGNTVNTAARMENTGQRNKIQVTQETADLITEAGKGHWIFQRIDDIAARGGIQTYWVEPQSNAQEAKLKNSAPTRVVAQTGGPVDSSQRLIDWNVDLLKRLLKRVVAHRRDEDMQAEVGGDYVVKNADGVTVRDEVTEFIILPKYDKTKIKTDPDTVQLGEKVEKQLREYVTVIESMYHDNPFHNFKHASNVCTSANKMFCSIVEEELFQRVSDPLTQFAAVFSSLIHDVDHAGVPNMQLIKEKPHVAALYRNKSVAEQNSVDLAWNLLMDPDYEALQDAIFHNNSEFKRFRQLVVNVVMATDIFDKELNGDRHSRWIKAFESESRTDIMDAESEGNLKATVIIEHVMQVADVMHTMQHFHSYQRWNERLFEEMYLSFATGRSRKDPSIDWYEGEIWFFDNCVIPLAQRVKDSGFFGQQGEDILRNAISNKRDWTIKGAEIVAGLIEKLEKKEIEALGEGEEKDGETENKDHAEDKHKDKLDNQDKHMIEWNVDLFKRMLRQILANRIASGQKEQLLTLTTTLKEGSTVRDEIVRFIDLPKFDKKAAKLIIDPETIELSKSIDEQLRDYLSFIASMYRDNEFHNFKHASNVSMAANKYLQRIVDENLSQQAADPLTQFAMLFSALIHDVDHTGVSNFQLVKEKQRIAVLYNNKSIAEQNSVDLAWTVLMDSGYKDLQAAIYSTQAEFDRFRQLVVNTVMATDLFDEELIADRNERWEVAFNEEKRDPSMSDEQLMNFRGTIVLEHVMQASDIGHTMQHFHSYRRWNERLFQEMYAAFENGRLEEDPSKSWYEGEIQFFDKYIIPLARKLKGCDMFGIAGEDALSCAQANRKEWVVKGVAIVQELKKRYQELKLEKLEKENKEKHT